jgi:Flp pilus assembly protein TadG
VATTLQRRTAGRVGERGVVSVEFAIVLPLLLAVLLGTVGVGLAYNNVLGIADGVRGGSRFGATTLDTSSWGSTVQAQTVALTYLNLPGKPAVVTSAMVCAKLMVAPATERRTSTCNTATAGPEPANPTGLLAGTCFVKVWARIPVVVDLKVLPSPIKTTNVDRQSIALYERPCAP